MCLQGALPFQSNSQWGDEKASLSVHPEPKAVHPSMDPAIKHPQPFPPNQEQVPQMENQGHASTTGHPPPQNLPKCQRSQLESVIIKQESGSKTLCKSLGASTKKICPQSLRKASPHAPDLNPGFLWVREGEASLSVSRSSASKMTLFTLNLCFFPGWGAGINRGGKKESGSPT